jgi:hypothetical protein
VERKTPAAVRPRGFQIQKAFKLLPGSRSEGWL